LAISVKPPVPWYREPWPWLLMAGPAVVVVAGFATLWLAVSSSDGLVVDDYYKQGLAINQTIERDVLAAQRGYRAEVALADGGRNIIVRLASAAGELLPETLQLRLVHPTRAGRDGLVLLRQHGPGFYEGTGPVLTAGRWILVLENLQPDWRLSGTVQTPGRTTALLLPENAK